MLAIIFPLSSRLDAVCSEIYGAERLPQKIIITYQPLPSTIVLEKTLRNIIYDLVLRTPTLRAGSQFQIVDCRLRLHAIFTMSL
jgi:hypothetical protein